MPPAQNRRRTIAALLLVCAAALAWAVVSFGPVVAFHLLPAGLTGEEERLAELLEVAPGKNIAEIGAGDGRLSVAIARRLEPGGTLYSTELDRSRLREIQERADSEAIRNLVVVAAGEASTNLPDNCCDAVFMRNVYHHIGDTGTFNRSLRRALRPGARVAIIDFPPGSLSAPGGGRDDDDGHGVSAARVAKEMERAGFVTERIEEDWGGRNYLVLLRAPGTRSDKAGRPGWERPVFALVFPPRPAPPPETAYKVFLPR